MDCRRILTHHHLTLPRTNPVTGIFYTQKQEDHMDPTTIEERLVAAMPPADSTPADAGPLSTITLPEVDA